MGKVPGGEEGEGEGREGRRGGRKGGEEEEGRRREVLPTQGKIPGVSGSFLRPYLASLSSESSMRPWGRYPVLLGKVLPVKTPAEGRWGRRPRAVGGVGSWLLLSF